MEPNTSCRSSELLGSPPDIGFAALTVARCSGAHQLPPPPPMQGSWERLVPLRRASHQPPAYSAADRRLGTRYFDPNPRSAVAHAPQTDRLHESSPGGGLASPTSPRHRRPRRPPAGEPPPHALAGASGKIPTEVSLLPLFAHHALLQQARCLSQQKRGRRNSSTLAIDWTSQASRWVHHKASSITTTTTIYNEYLINNITRRILKA
eukprot:TRINITY_DN65556_c0_g1_i1.p1 TRINITY_DN65556_c0_g1~~TRINITY_DN65556_c0_g1_i1.p1  ORF type:complete len:207 (+),score=23.10 TRINITY_DN65556_c0_g1_i1:383-1003(+)